MLGVRRFIRKGGYDVVISFMELPNFMNNFAAIGGKSWKVITGERSSMDATFDSKKGIVFSGMQYFSDVLVCNSENAKRKWALQKPKFRDKLRVIYNTVKLQDITTEYVPLRNNRLNILIPARIYHIKNPQGVIDALTLMSEEERSKIHIDWYGRYSMIFGETENWEEKMPKLIAEHHLEDCITIHEPTTDIHNKMNESDVVALFSCVEGLPNAICEGMKIGKPIIMSKVSDYNVLVDKTNGFLCDWNDVNSIKEVLVSASNLTKEVLMGMGANSKSKAEELFSTERVIEEWETIISN